MRTVRRYVAGVVTEAPVGDLVQSVQAIVAAVEPPGPSEIGVYDDAGGVIGGERWGTVDLDVLEPVDRVMWFERVAVDAGRDDAVDLSHRAVADPQVVERDVARRVERFGVHERDVGAGRPEIAHLHPSRDVLAEIDDLTRGGQAGDGVGSDRLDASDRWGR